MWRDVVKYTAEDSPATVCIKSLLIANRRQFIIILILIGMNFAWLYVFQSYDYTSTETITTTSVLQDTGEGGSANYTEKGDINNGEANGGQNDHN